MSRKLCGIFAIDARSLAAFRMAVGTILLVDVAIRAGDFAAHYTEAGIMPLAALRETLGEGSRRWSLYTLFAADWWPAFLMGLTAVCGCLLIAGLATRIATVAAWALVLSLHNRLPVAINAGDTLLHVLIFWAIFLPLGAKWSLDGLLRRRANRGDIRANRAPCSACTVASAAILLQVALLYVSAGVYKLTNDDWWSGLSLHYVMSFDAYARPAAAWALQYPSALKVLTWATVALEIGGPLLAFSPWRTGPLRLAVIAGFVAFHAGIEATMTVGLFSWVCGAGWLLFLPSGFWDGLATVLRARSAEGSPAGTMGAAGVPLDSGRGPTAGGFKWNAAPIAVGGLVGALLMLTVHWNATGIQATGNAWRPAWCRPVMELTGLRQQWKMFTRPPKHDGWPRAVARLADGTQWDLLENQAGFDWKRRELPSAMAPNHRWRKYYNVLLDRRNEHLRPYFCRFLAARFQVRHSQQIEWVRLYQIQEITGRPGEEDRFVRRLLHHEKVRSRGAFLDAAERGASEDLEIHPGV